MSKGLAEWYEEYKQREQAAPRGKSALSVITPGGRKSDPAAKGDVVPDSLASVTPVLHGTLLQGGNTKYGMGGRVLGLYPAELLTSGSTPPDGAAKADKANKGWTAAWQRQHTTKAGKSERRSHLAGSGYGARRGEAATS